MSILLSYLVGDMEASREAFLLFMALDLASLRMRGSSRFPGGDIFKLVFNCGLVVILNYIQFSLWSLVSSTQMFTGSTESISNKTLVFPNQV